MNHKVKVSAGKDALVFQMGNRKEDLANGSHVTGIAKILESSEARPREWHQGLTVLGRH